MDVYDARMVDRSDPDSPAGSEEREALLIVDSDRLAIRYTDAEGRTWEVTYAITAP